jgi:TonB family protein
MEYHNKKKFLQLPEYPGGGEAMKEFIGQNLRYPEKALQAGIEGFVLVGYEVNDNGGVLNARILKGLGHGCDEEALRVISLLRFEKVKNRGKRLKVTKKTRINFRMNKTTAQVSITYHNKPEKTGPGAEEQDKSPVIYNYTIDL